MCQNILSIERYCKHEVEVSYPMVKHVQGNLMCNVIPEFRRSCTFLKVRASSRNSQPEATPCHAIGVDYFNAE
ncbi:MAG TPA: hypothetical protein VEI57_13215 [Nitrospirota bacterium]|nr:hypothetical protein [Nitrospirota bacterium]